MRSVKTSFSTELLCLILFPIAILPRVPLLFTTPGHSDHKDFLNAGLHWFQTGMVGFHKPFSSPIATYFAGMLASWAQAMQLPYHYFYNALMIGLSGLTLLVLFRVFEKYLTSEQSLVGVIVFNFFSQFYVLAGSFSEVGLFVFFYVVSFYFYQRKKIWTAIIFSFLATNTRIQGLALTAPMVGLFLLQSLKQKKIKIVIQHGLLCLALSVLCFALQFKIGGWHIFQQQYHIGEWTAVQKVAAFFHRGLNILGPFGVLWCLWLAWLNHKKIFKSLQKSEEMLLVLASVLLTWMMLLKAPWDAYHHIPVALVLIAFAIKQTKSKVLVAVFVFSALLPNLVQIQVKPWKFPPYRVTTGVLKAHLHQIWDVQGGS